MVCYYLANLCGIGKKYFTNCTLLCMCMCAYVRVWFMCMCPTWMCVYLKTSNNKFVCDLFFPSVYQLICPERCVHQIHPAHPCARPCQTSCWLETATDAFGRTLQSKIMGLWQPWVKIEHCSIDFNCIVTELLGWCSGMQNMWWTIVQFIPSNVFHCIYMYIRVVSMQQFASEYPS